MGDFIYPGAELELFARAVNWKRYFARMIRPHMGRRVLEVGAGLGGTTPFLHDSSVDQWICLEPDHRMQAALEASAAQGSLPGACMLRLGKVEDLGGDELFDTILYIDVLEHIEEDAVELEAAYAHLDEGGRLIILAPAHQWLFSRFDEEIGHFRRYSRKSLSSAVPRDLRCTMLHYLDSAGLAASMANALALRRRIPSLRQVLLWDRVMVPLSVVLDRITGYSMGKSILGVWRKQAPGIRHDVSAEERQSAAKATPAR